MFLLLFIIYIFLDLHIHVYDICVSYMTLSIFIQLLIIYKRVKFTSVLNFVFIKFPVENFYVEFFFKTKIHTE